ncbi:MAG: Bacterial regulatory protein luxR family [Pseudomonadota bacterium]|jgi:DNA-binding NarL/FixJ family response regulator
MLQFNPKPILTSKELLILKMFSTGMLREGVADVIQVQPKTLRVYLTYIYEKLGCKKLHQAVVWYLVEYPKLEI